MPLSQPGRVVLAAASALGAVTFAWNSIPGRSPVRPNPDSSRPRPDATIRSGGFKSGLQPGDLAPPFDVRDVTGDFKGKTLCYR